MDLLILGASARSAAASALRIGLRPICADLFADLDLARSCPAIRIEPADYPEGLATFADGLPSTPWLYTGAIENRPALVDRISRRHPLLGNPGTTLRTIRDPSTVAQVIWDAGLVAPEVRTDPDGLPQDGSWLVKPLASGGGRGIHPWTGHPTSLGRSVSFQERIEGLSLAALFVGEAGSARCLGITRQFVGRPGNRYAYRGSLGPWPVTDEVGEQVHALGRVLASAFGLLGIFGVDLILANGRAWPIEVNPRYTASVEVLEWAFGRSLLADHLLAFGRDLGVQAHSSQAEGFVGKAIIHADRPVVWPGIELQAEPGHWTEVADIPSPGNHFRPGDPVLSVFARADSVEECRRRLASKVREWRIGLRSGTR